MGLPGSFLTPLAVAYASPLPPDSVHFCQPVDPDQLNRHHYPPAAKRLQDLNVGEPRTVRLFYFLPNDRPYRTEVVDSMKSGILDLQTFFAEQMEAHGHGNTTFKIETNDQGDPVVHRIDGDYAGSHYSSRGYTEGEIQRAFDNSQNIILIIMDVSASSAHGRGTGSKGSGWAMIYGEWNWFAAAHELGHSFGLHHDFRDNEYIMSYGRAERASAKLSPCAARFLTANPYFNSDVPLQNESYPTVELVSSSEYPFGSASIPVQLRVRDDDGLHQLILFVMPKNPFLGGTPEVKACHGLSAETNTVVEFNFDGRLPSDNVGTSPEAHTTLSNTVQHRIHVIAVDTDGNRNNIPNSDKQFNLEAGHSRQHTATVDRPDYYDIGGLGISPDGSILAIGAAGIVELLDATKREKVTVLRHSNYVNWSVAFSPDGTLLAAGSGDGTIKVWNVTTKAEVASLDGHTGQVLALDFSSDGTLLASGSRDNTVKLWNVTTWTNTGTLEGHTDGIVSLDFLPDGKLATKSWRDGTVRLWDVQTRSQNSTINTDAVGTVALSPDGATLASSISWAIKLWSLSTGVQTAALNHMREYNYAQLAFSPDGTILAVVANGLIEIWDVPTRELLATISGGPGGVGRMLFSPNGKQLIGTANKGIKFWDVSEWGASITPVSDRTPQVRDAIVAAVPGVNSSKDVTAAHLSSISLLNLKEKSITSLKTGDFDGLTSLATLLLDQNQLTTLPEGVFNGLSALTKLELYHNQLTTLPEGVFSGLSALTKLELYHNELTALPEGVFSGLSALTELILGSNQLSTLPEGIFSGLSALTEIYLYGEQLTSLPEGIFSGLSALSRLNLGANQLTTLPEGIFSGLSALADVRLHHNQLATLPEGIFSGLSALTALFLGNNAIDPMPLNVSLEKTGEGQFLAVAPSGAPFDLVLPLIVSNGSINGGATTITIPAGRVESDTLTVTRTSGATFAATVDIGNLPGLPANHSGYKLVKSGDLPLVMTEGTIVIWSATMTVGDNQYGKGWTSRTSLSGDLLSDREFDFEGHTYRFSLIFRSNTLGGSLVVSFASDGAGTIANQATRTKFNFHVGEGVGEKVFNLGEGHYNIVGTPRDREIRHSSWKISWNKGDRVSLKMTLAPETEWKVISVSDRTPQVRDAIIVSAGVNSANDVTDAHLADITSLNLGYKSIRAVKSGDFSGLSSLTTLFLHNNYSLTSLPEDVFDGLSSLKFLNLQDNGLTSLPENVFDGLASLIHIGLYGNSLTTLPEDVFGGLSSLHRIMLYDNELTALPKGTFEGVTTLQLLHLQGNFVDPLPLTVSLERVGTDQFKAVAPTGAPFNILLPLNVTNGNINGGATAVTIPLGSVESGPLTVTQTSTSTAAVTVDIGALPGLPSSHQGYYLFKSNDLPLEVISEATSQQAATDFNGDGKTDFVDFFLFIDAFGGTDSRFDLDGSGTVDFVDFFQFVDAFDQPGQAKLLALAREMLGLPSETELQQNAPNPFNSETIISWFLLEPGPVRLEVFSLTGQRLAVLHQGPLQAGFHRIHWDGRDDKGRPLASGVYLYRLVGAETVLTQKLTLLR